MNRMNRIQNQIRKNQVIKAAFWKEWLVDSETVDGWLDWDTINATKTKVKTFIQKMTKEKIFANEIEERKTQK